jgi:hypothetical protein
MMMMTRRLDEKGTKDEEAHSHPPRGGKTVMILYINESIDENSDDHAYSRGPVPFQSPADVTGRVDALVCHSFLACFSP